MKPLADLTDDERAALAGPEAWWYALQVMGRKPMLMKQTAVINDLTYVLSTGEVRSTGRYSPWEKFGLAVEWIGERRGILGSWDDREGLLRIYMGGDDVRYEEAQAPTLPDAAARWIVEHGHKIAEVKP